MARLLALAGSARSASLNKRLVQLVARRAEEAGAQVTVVDLADLDIPLYDGDLEEQDGVPADVTALRTRMIEHDGLLLACPEYNGSITPLLKNVIDWCTRPAEGVPMLAAFRGKTALLTATSPGALGGLRGLVHVRAILSGIGVHVHPDQLAVGAGGAAFTYEGTLEDEALDKRLAAMAAGFVRFTDALRG